MWNILSVRVGSYERCTIGKSVGAPVFHVHGDDPELRVRAARAMAQIGEEALTLLRDGMSDPSPQVREASVGAVLAVAGVADLSALYDYYGAYPDDDANGDAHSR